MRTRNAPTHGRQAFSIVELMVAVLIVALLATLVTAAATGHLKRAKRETAKADIAQISAAIDAYVIHNGGRYPDSLEELVTPDVNGETYLKDLRSIPVDPWGSEYAYEPPTPATPDCRILTLGEDGAPGGEGDAQDIDNFTARERPRRE